MPDTGAVINAAMKSEWFESTAAIQPRKQSRSIDDLDTMPR